MTGQNNHINDQHIRDLLKWRLLEQGGDDDVLTQKLMDMEAKLAFGTEALSLPSLQKENELLQKLTGTKNKNIFLKWIIPGIIIALIVAVALLYKQPDKAAPATRSLGATVAPAENGNLPSIQTHTIDATDSTSGTVSIIVIREPQQESASTDTTETGEEEKWTAGDAGIRVNYRPAPNVHDPKFIDPYEHIPLLSEKQREYTKKMKEKMVKAVLKHDKNAWAYIPSGTGMIYGEQVSVYGFYMATMEVTNNSYRIFLNDLIIQDRIDDFLKAVPDTAKWMKLCEASGRSFCEPMRKNYYWHPAYNDFPVVNVSREGAKLYCDWLTISANEWIKAKMPKDKWESLYMNDVRIPAEEEWMIAARGGLGDVPYPWTIAPDRTLPQNSKGCYLCNFSIINYPDSLKKISQCANSKIPNAMTSAGSVSDDYFCTAMVNSYNPNNYGLYCMSGNVAEMVSQYKTRKPCAKGGSWWSDAEHVKISALPEFVNSTEGSPQVGFRPVFTAKAK